MGWDGTETRKSVFSMGQAQVGHRRKICYNLDKRLVLGVATHDHHGPLESIVK
jgi:hypothetical protein